jgi:FeS assembly SUF system protein
MTEQSQAPRKRIWPPDPVVPVPAAGPTPEVAAEEQKPRTVREKIIAAMRKVFDPEIPVNIYDLGLIYKIDLNEETKRVVVQMTLTTPHCPEAETLPVKVQSEIERIPEVDSAEVNIVWNPPWEKKMMSEEAKLILGIE